MLIVHVTANISPQALESLRDTAQRMVTATRAEPPEGWSGETSATIKTFIVDFTAVNLRPCDSSPA